METICRCPANCRCFNKPKTYDVKLIGRTVDDWLREFTEDGDMLRIHALRGGGLAIQNQRTLACYVLEAKNG